MEGCPGVHEWNLTSVYNRNAIFQKLSPLFYAILFIYTIFFNEASLFLKDRRK